MILTAGLGERLRPLTYLVPKPYLPLRDGLIIERILKWATEELSFDDVIVVLAYMADKVLTMLGDSLGNVRTVVSDQLLGTAGQLWYVRDYVSEDDNVVVINGDVITNTPLAKAYDYHRQHNADLTIIASHLSIPIKYGVLEYEGDGRFRDWVEKPIIKLAVVTGIYIMRGSLIRMLRRERLDMNNYIKNLNNQGFRIYVLVGDNEYIDLGTPQDYLNYVLTH
ncbi:nucleotidyltransferase family protein [Vulcanisaeta thermophila]|uniref:nucleotidyltransferase family protein n=1 Tax=Vulcanisaeta thermophila TaxID=867917 RepID=UPI001EE2C5E8|nr:nucleotidyltransferase family protein [Vulcanisaeta thermophila]